MFDDGKLRTLLAGCRDNLTAYSIAVDKNYVPYRWHRFLAGRLQAAVKRGYGRIMVFAPPQHGKSEMVSRKLPAWFLGKYPELPVIAASYGNDLAEKNGKAVRDVMQSDIHQAIFPQSVLDRSSTAKTDFQTTEGGQYLGVTVRGGGTGFSARLFVIDDPFKNRLEAESRAVREQIKDWYKSVVYTRLAQESVLVIMHTRWHLDDLAGWLLDEHTGEDWEVVNLPALAESEDQLGRKPDEVLCPERFNEAALNERRIAVGSRDWLSLYQQRCIEHEGGELRKIWLQRFDRITPADAQQMQRLLLIDPNRVKSATSDNCAMAIVGLGADRNYYLLDAVVDKLNLAERGRAVIELHRKWQPHYVGYKKASAEADIEYIRELQNDMNYRFAVHPLGEKGDKNERIRRLIPDLESLRIYIPWSMHKTRTDGTELDVVDYLMNVEYIPFPAGRNDDLLDCLSEIENPQVKIDWPSGVPKPAKRGATSMLPSHVTF